MEWQKGFAKAPKMDFMILRNESTLMMISVEISTEIIYQSEWILAFWSVPSTYVGMFSPTSGPAVLG